MKVKTGVGLAALAGLLLAIGLIAHHGFEAVGEAILTAGLWGLLAVTLYHLVPLTFSSLGWWSLLDPAWRAPAILFIWVRLIREAVNNLLPAGQIGGEVVGARVLTFRGVRPGIAGASVVVDLTMEVLTQFLFTLLGLWLLFLGHYDDGTAYWLAIGLAIMAPALVGFVLAQHLGLFRLLERLLERLAEKWGLGSLSPMSGLHDTIKALYRNRRALLASGLSHLLSWILGAGEIWLALYFMDSPVSLRDALILESLGQAVRSVAFAVPAALGVQEGGFLLIGGMLGLGPDVALALSLVKRVRDVLLGVPALAGWHFLEGRRIWVRVSESPEKVNGS